MIKNILRKGGFLLATLGLSVCTPFNNTGICQDYIYYNPKENLEKTYEIKNQKNDFNSEKNYSFRDYGYSKNIFYIYFESQSYFCDFDTDGDGILDRNDPWPYNYGPVVDRNFNGYIDSRDWHLTYPSSNWSFRYGYYSYPQFSYNYYGEYYLRDKYWNINKGSYYHHYFYYDFDENYKNRTHYGKRRSMQKDYQNSSTRINKRNVGEYYESRSSRRGDYKNRNYGTPSRRNSEHYSPKRKERNLDYNPSSNYQRLEKNTRRNNYIPSYDRNNTRRNPQEFNSGNSRRSNSPHSNYKKNNENKSSSETRRGSSNTSGSKKGNSSSGRRR
jgi:hypothetical protein